MADGEVNIKTKIDNSGLDKGLKEMKNKLDGAGKQTETAGGKIKGFSDKLKNLNAGSIATAAGVAGIATAVKKTVDALNDCAAAYRVQANAEEALQIAAKNNPYLNDESVYNLRNFAGELQGLSEIGDEVSLQVMSQLAATGRNEEQIMSIMSAAADMAAVTGQDIASAAQQLNATLNGNAGALGRQIGAINNLTKEELESGKAIELVAAQYKGAAAATADVEVQLSNAWGDFKENIGRGWQNVTQPVKQFFLDVLKDINEATAKTNDIKDADKKRGTSEQTAANTKILIDAEEEKIKNTQKEINSTMELLEDEEKLAQKIQETRGSVTKATFQKSLVGLQKQYENETNTLRELTDEYNRLSDAEKAAADAAAAQATAEEKAAELKKRDDEATAFINSNTKALEEQTKAIQLKADVTGEEIDAGEMYNVYMQSYIDLITKSNGLVTEENQAAKDRLSILQQWAQKAKDAATEEERLTAAQNIIDNADKLIKDFGYTSIYEQYTQNQQELLKIKEELNNSEVLSEKEKAEKIKAIDEALVKNRKQLWSGIASEVNGYANNISEIINNAANMALEVENNRMKTELANLEIKYRKGELGEEEYQEKVAEAKKKGAKLQYQIEMAQWSANILTATANTAVGVTQAIAQGGVAGIITGALVGAAGAVQLASIMAAKPIPHFATGGFIGGMNGASMGADNTLIAARGGELMVNAAQQRRLWDVLNGNAGGMGGGINLVVNNNASNVVSTTTQIDRNKIELMIDARVNDGLKKGRFNAGLNAANASMSGDFYGI